MTEPVRSDRPLHAEPYDRERDARIEELLLTGLSHYFSGQHELAINVWTRKPALASRYCSRARIPYSISTSNPSRETPAGDTCSAWSRKVRVYSDGVYRVKVSSAADGDHMTGVSRTVALDAHR